MTHEETYKLNHSLKILAKTSVIIFIGLVVSKLLTYVYRIIIARQFGPEIYGYFSIVLMIFGLFAMFSLAGLFEGIVRYISYYRGFNNKENIKRTFRVSLIFITITSIIAGIILFLLAEFLAVSVFHTKELIILFKFFSFALPLYAISQVFLATMRAFEKVYPPVVIVSIIEPIIKILILASLILAGLNFANSISISFIIGFLISLILSFLYCKKYLFKLFINSRIHKNKGITKELLRYSLPLLFSTVIIFIFGWTDTFLIGYLKTARDVGIYNAALPMAYLLSLVPSLFTQLFFPIINREYAKKNKEVIKELSQQIGKWIFLINFPLLIIFLLFPGTVLNLLFGQGYLEGKIALTILSIGFFILAQSEISLNLLGMIKKSKLRLFNIILALAIAITLNFIFIPMEKILFLDNPTGIVGAAIATTLAYVIYCSLTVLQAYYFLKIIPIRRKILRVLFSGIISAILLMIVRNFILINIFTLVLLGFLFMLTYTLLIFLTKSLDENDLMIIQMVQKRVFRKNKNHSLG